MPNRVNVIIRDAVPEDIPGCLAISHVYETDHVWQMHLRQEDGFYVAFRPERLPRPLESVHPSSAERLTAALAAEHCFVVAALAGNETHLLGYLAMPRGAMSHVGQIVDFAVDDDVRRCGIGSRLISVAANWARENHITHLQAAVQTTNHPAMTFLSSLRFSFCGFNDHYFPDRDIAVFFTQAVR